MVIRKAHWHTPHAPTDTSIYPLRASGLPQGSTLRPVKKLLVLLIVGLLATQSVWAAVAGACLHLSAGAGGASSAVQTEHLGHHDHQHEHASPNTPSNTSAAGDTDASSFHSDCGACHLSHTPASAVAVHVSVPLAPATTQPSSAVSALASHISPPLDRPNWLA